MSTTVDSQLITEQEIKDRLRDVVRQSGSSRRAAENLGVHHGDLELCLKGYPMLAVVAEKLGYRPKRMWEKNGGGVVRAVLKP